MTIKRWSDKVGDYVEDAAVDAFLEMVIAVCIKHNMSIGHEDHHGSFIISRPFSESDAKWLARANLEERD